MHARAGSFRYPPLLLWLTLGFAALVALAWVTLAVLFPPARVQALVREQLRHALARDVRFAKASLGLWPPIRLTVERPELAEPGGFGQGAAFSAKALDLDLDVFALLGKKLKVERLVLEEPAVHLVLRADGSTNLDDLAASQQQGAPAPAMDLDVKRFSIRGGRVLIDDLKAGRRIAFGIATTTSLLAEQGGNRIATGGETDLTDLAFGPLSAQRLSDLDRGLSRLAFHLEHRGKFDAKAKRLALERLALKLGGTTLALTGIVDDPGPHARFDVRASGDGLNLADVLSWVSLADAQAVKGLSGAGHLSFDLAARGTAAAATAPPAVRGWLTVRDGAFRYAGAPVGVEALVFTANFAPDSLTIPDLRARVSGQPVRAALAATHFADPQVRFAVQGNLDLAAIAPLLAQQGAQVAGHANVDVRGSGRAKDPGALTLDGRAELLNVSVHAKDLPQPIEGVNGIVLLSQQRASVQHLTARAGKSSYTLDAQVSRPLALMARPDAAPPADVTFDFRSPYLDLAELLPTTPGAPFLPNAKGTGRIAIARLKQGKLDVTNVTAPIVLSPAKLESPGFSLTGYGGTIGGNASFDLHDTRKPAYAIKANVANVQANDLLSVWTPAKGLMQGTLSTTLDFSGAGSEPADIRRTLTLVGLAALSQGQLGPGPALEAIAQYVKIPRLREVKFHDLKLPMRIEQGRLITDAVTLSGPSGDWKLAGAVGFDGSLDYAVSVTLPPEVGAALNARSALAAGALSDDKGRVLLDLHVTGNARSPRIAWDTNAMRDRLAGRASQALAEQRTKLEADAKAAAQRALAERLGMAADSTKRNLPSLQLPAAKDSLKKAAGDLLKGFFGGGSNKKSAQPDTSKH